MSSIEKENPREVVFLAGIEFGEKPNVFLGRVVGYLENWYTPNNEIISAVAVSLLAELQTHLETARSHFALDSVDHVTI